MEWKIYLPQNLYLLSKINNKTHKVTNNTLIVTMLFLVSKNHKLANYPTLSKK